MDAKRDNLLWDELEIKLSDNELFLLQIEVDGLGLDQVDAGQLNQVGCVVVVPGVVEQVVQALL